MRARRHHRVVVLFGAVGIALISGNAVPAVRASKHYLFPSTPCVGSPDSTLSRYGLAELRALMQSQLETLDDSAAESRSVFFEAARDLSRPNSIGHFWTKRTQGLQKSDVLKVFGGEAAQTRLFLDP